MPQSPRQLILFPVFLWAPEENPRHCFSRQRSEGLLKWTRSSRATCVSLLSPLSAPFGQLRLLRPENQFRRRGRLENKQNFFYTVDYPQLTWISAGFWFHSSQSLRWLYCVTFRSGGEGQTPQGASSLALVSEYTGWCGRSRLWIIFPRAHANRFQCSFHEIRGHFVAEESQISKAPLQNELISPWLRFDVMNSGHGTR